MRFIDQRRAGFLFPPAGVGPLKRRFRVPHLRAQLFQPFVHGYAGAVGGQPFKLILPVSHPQLQELPVLQGVPSLQQDLPHAVFLFLHRMGLPVPAVEVAGQMHLVRGGQPFPHGPAGLRPVDAEIQVSVGEGDQLLRVADQLGAPLLEAVHPQVDLAGERLQPGVDGRNGVRGRHSGNIHHFSLPVHAPALCCFFLTGY